MNRRLFLRTLGLLPVIAAGAQVEGVLDQQAEAGPCSLAGAVPATQQQLDDASIRIDALDPRNIHHQRAIAEAVRYGVSAEAVHCTPETRIIFFP